MQLEPLEKYIRFCYNFDWNRKVPSRKDKDGAWLLASYKGGGDGMSDYEILAIVILLITLVFTVHLHNHK